LVDKNDYRISLQQEVLDFPKQTILTRDGARLSLDAVLSYQISSAASVRTMVYSVKNLPLVLSRLLQAHIRNVAATLEVDQIIEDSSAMNVLTQLLNDTAMSWGIRVNFVKIQRVEAHELSADLAKKKNAELTNKNTIINAKSTKASTLLTAEGERDQMIKRAEGEAQKKMSIATGTATAIINNARAEAEALGKVIPMLVSRGEDPIKYLLSQKYIEKLSEGLGNASVQFVPMELENVAAERVMGVQPMDTLRRRVQ
jgi:regulator of protease activity HflC (stomatin/prohibitin superfamily)